MSIYTRNYGSWSSKSSLASEKATSPSSLLSRFGPGSSSKSSASTYKPVTSVRERASQVETTQTADKPSFREKYAARSYGVEPESKVEAKAAAPTYKRYGSSYSPTAETPSLRVGSTSRFGAQIARSPISEKAPTVFGVSGYTRSVKEEEKTEPPAPGETITLVTRGTSPTPPSNSSFLRTRRAEMDRTIEKTIPRLKPRHTTYAVECQTDEKCIEDAKLESKLSAVSALTARTPSPSTYSRYNSGTTKYTPRTSAYHGNRPNELSLKSTSSMNKTPSQEDIKADASPTKEKKLEGKDTTRIGGFSYARPTDLPLALNDGKSDALISPSKLRSTSPQTPSSSWSSKREPSISNEQHSKPHKTSISRTNSFSESTSDTTTHSIKNESPSVSISPSAKTPLSLSRSSAKITSPDRCKLPPPSPKNEITSNVPNKDFRKSELNMNLSSSSESLSSQKLKLQASDQSRLGRSPSLKSQSGLATSKSLAKLPSSPSSTRSTQSTNKLIPPVIKKPESSESSSEESSSSGSSSSSETESSESEEEEPVKLKSNMMSSVNAGSKLSLASSRTSAQISSADEGSMSLDKPPRPPSSLRSNKPIEERRTEEAKSVVVRALTPVAGVMKVKYPGSSADELSDKDKKNNVLGSSAGKIEKSGSKTSIGSEKKNFKIQQTQSGERAWWMGSPNENKEKISSDKSDSDSNLTKHDMSKHLIDKESNECNQITSPSPSKVERSSSKSSLGSDKKNLINQRNQSGERSSWMGSPNANVEKQSSERSGLEIYKPHNTVSTEHSQHTANQTVCISPKTDGAKSTSASETEMKPPIPKHNKLKKADSGSSSDVPGLEKSPSSKALRKDKSKASLFKIKRIESGERPWWLQESEDNTSSGIQDMPLDIAIDKGAETDVEDSQKTSSSRKKESSDMLSPHIYQHKNPYRITKIESGERAWWLGEESDEAKKHPPRPKSSTPTKRPKDLPLFIGRHTNIDDVLGTQAPPPAAFRTPQNSSDESDDDSEEIFEVKPDEVKIHDSTPMMSSITRPNGMIKLDDTALQLYKEGDYGAYLDLDASINEQQEEFENFQSNRKNSIVLRTQLSVRVHTIIEKLMSSEGRELRRALFSLKQIFQEDKDLVHEFVQNDGLSCLIKVGSDADQNYQNYILRALGQVMLYVDGMNGVIEHSPTVQWLYILVASKFRLVVKTALKLLLVFVEYVENNSVLLIKAIQTVDGTQGVPLWSNVMRLMKEYDAADTELLIYATSLINKTLNGLPDQDTYYDQVDALEEQGFENIIRRYMSKQGTDLDLLRQFQIYEAVLQHEDGEQKGAPLKQLDETIRKTLRHRKCLTATLNPIERRKSRRHSTGTSPLHLTLNLSRPPNELDPGSQTDDYHGGVHNGFCNGDSHARTVKDLTQKLASTLGSPILDADGKPVSRVGDMKGIISKAKEGLAKSQSKADVLKSPTSEIPPVIKPPEIKKSETELHWEELVNGCTRSLALCDLDFTDLLSDDEQSVLAPANLAGGIPPPPPPCGIPPPIPAPAVPPPLNTSSPARLSSPVRKNKKTVKLFWKEVRDDPVVFAKLNSNALIWDEMSPVNVDTQKLEHLFESRAKDLITKKQQEMNKNKEVIVLDPKRSNAINIGMTKLPPPRSIKTAILKMDATIMNREGIEKLLTMLPTEEECSKIQEAQAANPELPLGSAEQFLLTLASISELSARLKLWAFKLDFENSEKEIAEPLMDLKQGIETLKANKTFRGVLGTLLSIGIFLNGNEVKGFQIEYLAKVPEVKDTVHKHSLLHHLCHMVMEKFPDSSDLYSEIGAVTRASKVDFDELTNNIVRLETECKASFDHLKVITKHDGACTNMKVKISDFLVDCAEHIIVLAKVHRRVMNRYFKFCLWLGIPYHRVQATKPNELCRIVSEFALEYRTTRERVMQQLEKKASHRERNKTRGKMITEVGKFRSQDDRADAELRQLLGNDSADNESTLTGSLPWRRQRKDNLGRASLGHVRNNIANGNITDADDEILESLVKTATKIPATRTAPRERKRTRNADRKSLLSLCS